MTTAHQELKVFFGNHLQTSDAFWQEFIPLWEPYSAKRREILTSAGQREQYIYFVLEGIQRIYYLSDDAKEATLIFTYAPSFSGVVDSFLSQQPSRFYLETLTPSQFLRIPHDVFFQQCQKYKELNQSIFQLAASALDGVLYRMAELQLLSSEDKFRSLLKRSPHLLTLIPHKYLASYLGIDPTTFSKFLGRIKI